VGPGAHIPLAGIRFAIGFDTGVRETPPLVDTVISLEPLGYWRFEEAEGSAAISVGVSETDVTGTLEGTPNLNIAGPGADSPNLGLSSDNSAIVFDGIDDAMLTGQPILNDVTEFTMMGFFKPNNLSGSRKGLWGQRDVVELGFRNTSTLLLDASGGGGSVTGPTLPCPGRLLESKPGHWIRPALAGSSGRMRAVVCAAQMGVRGLF